MRFPLYPSEAVAPRDRADALQALASHHGRARALAETLTEAQLRRQYHPELSPVGWHLGHCALMEHHWVEERVGEAAPDSALHALYFPELSPKDERATRLPARDALMAWTTGVHERTLSRFADPPGWLNAHPLMADDYLLHFLEQHFAQHHETLLYCLTAITASEPASAPGPDGDGTPYSAPTGPDAIHLAPGRYRVGADHVRAYDNERPSHTVQLEGAWLARRPVTNAQWLAFMAAGGYGDDTCWSNEGAAWRERNRVTYPWNWHPLEGGRFISSGPLGYEPLQPDAPVSGISHYEAEAFARWAGARLPHEFEWEAADRQGLLTDTGRVWEWCSNPLAPYPGFRPFPYDGYSMPWFDGEHPVLRGGCRFTHPGIKRSSFRNFFQRHVRHQQAGLRLAWDTPPSEVKTP
ncbi:iron(II)-dependent oxidoreductase [Alkalispirillum mobile]|uniref:Iron(II)-dependent oxidoreductase n=1 Tax=Alkalispirillum mobile TaxID=85925 RepID=A0A498CFS9_9GAMM|nr:SUMF1/EgtB/PvdO family nonheme iron enzyme [Alkalispirillum mobile]RLK51161.1 iron(II)-dependent oxidoreductase [Alkalispirillum mobile]